MRIHYILQSCLLPSGIHLYPSYCSTDFGLEFYCMEPVTMARAETSEFQDIFSDQSNMQQPVNTFSEADYPGMQEFHDNEQHKDWIHELNYF